LLIDQALGERKGIARFGSAYCPLDEALARVVVDVSGRGSAHFVGDLGPLEKVGNLSCQMVPHIFESFASAFKVTMHIDVIRGINTHHKVEASFKAMAVALRQALTRTEHNDTPSTKGVLF